MKCDRDSSDYLVHTKGPRINLPVTMGVFCPKYKDGKYNEHKETTKNNLKLKSIFLLN